MDYTKIINNILIDPDQTSKCLNKLEELKLDNTPNTELLHVARYLALENIDLNNPINTSSTINEIINELSYITTNNDNTNDTIIALKLSSIYDSVLSKLSKSEKKVYIYRYFFAESLNNISSICDCSTSSITKTLSSINSTIKSELANENINCSLITLLKSFSDIDNNHLMVITGNPLNDNDDTKKDANTQTNNLISKLRNISYKKLLNACFASIIIILIIIIAFLFNKKPNSTNSNNIKNNTTIDDTTDKFDKLFSVTKNKIVVNVNELLEYRNDSNYNSDITLNTENFSGPYEQIPLDESVPLVDCLGDKIDTLHSNSNECEFYKLKGHRDSQYIIRYKSGNYSLFKLSYVHYINDETEIPDSAVFSEVAKNFYGLFTSAQIINITAQNLHITANYDDIYVKRLIDTPTDIEDIYNIMSDSKYVYTLNTDMAYDNQLSYDYLMNTSVKLIIELYDGTMIDSIYYRPEYNYFFEANTFMAFMPEAEYTSLSNINKLSLFGNPVPYEETDITANESGEDVTIVKANLKGAYLDTMFGFKNHEAKVVDPENWQIYSYIMSPTGSYLDFYLNQDTYSSVNGLYLSKDFVIEKYENGKWIEAPYIDDYYPEEYFPFYLGIPTYNYNLRRQVYIQGKYKDLETGDYRIIFTIYNSNCEDKQNPISRDYIHTFKVNEDNSIVIN